MSDDSSGSPGPSSKSWLNKISQAFSPEAKSNSDVLEFLREAEQNTIIDPDSMSIMEGAMQVTDMQVREIMIPRVQMVTVKASQDHSEYLPDIISSAHSRFPVLGDDPDDIIGILLAKDLIKLLWENNLTKDALQDILRPATFIPESKRLNQLLKEFKETRNHMAIVIDEYGGVGGLVTIEDVLEQIVGEIEDEHDFDDEVLIKKRSDSEFIVKATTPVDDFNEYFESNMDEEEFDTIGGLILKEFGRVPHRDEFVKFNGFKFTILNADSRSIRLIQANKV